MASATRAWLSRYAVDTAEPTLSSAARDLGVRALLPTLGLVLVNLAIGFAIVGPGQGWRFEASVNTALQAGRTPFQDGLARAVSTAGNAATNIVFCVIFMVVIWLVTRRWWMAILPGVSLSIEAIVHAATSVLVNRDRPPVDHLDAAMPTASFPSGHVGATLAQLLILMLLTWQWNSTAGRLVLGIAAIGFVTVLAWSRLYLGMHHASDVAVGVINGIIAAGLSWNFLRRRT